MPYGRIGHERVVDPRMTEMSQIGSYGLQLETVNKELPGLGRVGALCPMGG